MQGAVPSAAGAPQGLSAELRGGKLREGKTLTGQSPRSLMSGPRRDPEQVLAGICGVRCSQLPQGLSNVLSWTHRLFWLRPLPPPRTAQSVSAAP